MSDSRAIDATSSRLLSRHPRFGGIGY